MEGITVVDIGVILPPSPPSLPSSKSPDESESKEDLILKKLKSKIRKFKTVKERFEEQLNETTVLRRTINDVIENAIIRAYRQQEICFVPGNEDRISYDPELFDKPDPYYDLPKVGNPFRLTTENFTPTLGLKMIQHFMRTWKLSRNWVDFTSFKEQVDELYATKYKYHVVFGMPTPVQPLPMEIGRAFFTLVSIKWKAPDFPLDFYYRLEGSYYVHRYGDEFEFCPEWAENAVRNKLSLKYRIINYISRSDVMPVE